MSKDSDSVSFEVEGLTWDAWRVLGQAMANVRNKKEVSIEETKAIQAAFDAAYEQDQKEAEASLRVRPAAKRRPDPVGPAK